MIGLVLAAILAVDAGSPGLDSPVIEPAIVRLDSGGYLFNDAAMKRVDDEVRRLQMVEQEHKQEEPSGGLTLVLVAGTVGLVLGAITGSIIVSAIKGK